MKNSKEIKIAIISPIIYGDDTNCLLLICNEDGSADTYDYNTFKHLEHYKI